MKKTVPSTTPATTLPLSSARDVVTCTVLVSTDSLGVVVLVEVVDENDSGPGI